MRNDLGSGTAWRSFFKRKGPAEGGGPFLSISILDDSRKSPATEFHGRTGNKKSHFSVLNASREAVSRRAPLSRPEAVEEEK